MKILWLLFQFSMSVGCPVWAWNHFDPQTYKTQLLTVGLSQIATGVVVAVLELAYRGAQKS
jgi:hypothetical protein